MEASIWSATLAEFRERASGAEPVPAGVAISAVTASLALGLVAKVLEITRRRKNFAGDAQRIEALREVALRESIQLSHLADEDIRAFNLYMDSVRLRNTPDFAIREAIRVPMEAVRSGVRGLEVCREATPFCGDGLASADLGAAAALLSGAVRAIMLSVESNLGELGANDPFGDEIKAELSALRASRQ
jgi:formiminotetrahydrofolate cyclodeaminase